VQVRQNLSGRKKQTVLFKSAGDTFKSSVETNSTEPPYIPELQTDGLHETHEISVISIMN